MSFTSMNQSTYSKPTEEEKVQVWDQLTEEGTGPSDSELDSSFNSGLVSSSGSDNEREASSEAPKMKLPPGLEADIMVPRPLPGTPKRRSRKAPLAEVLTSKLHQVSAGRPVKVWLSSDYKPLKVLKPEIPAKKKPAFTEYAGKTKTLDPEMPAKKHIPEWLANFGDATEKRAAPKPRSMPVPQVVQSRQVGPAPR